LKYFIILDTYFSHHENDQKRLQQNSSSTNTTCLHVIGMKHIQDQSSNSKQGSIMSFMDGMNSNEQVKLLLLIT